MAIGEGDVLHDLMFGSSSGSLELHAELAQVKDILGRAQQCRVLQDAESGWNEQFHCRVLELALKDQAGIGYQNMYLLPIYFQRPPCDQLRDFNRFTVFDNMFNTKQYDSKNLPYSFETHEQ